MCNMSLLIHLLIKLIVYTAGSSHSFNYDSPSSWFDNIYTYTALTPEVNVDEQVSGHGPDCGSLSAHDQAWVVRQQSPFLVPPRDHFKCGHCTCFNCTRDGHVVATCTKHVPYVMTKMPQNLPVKTINLNMDQNQLYNFTLRDVARYRILSYLELRNNKIKVLSLLPCKNVTSLLLLDLSGNLLVSIDDGWFSCLRDLVSLNLAGNQLTAISNETLLGLSNLKYLDLSSNRLKQIQYGAFDSCENLKTLNLGQNPLSYSRMNFHPRLFQPIKQLEVLSIQKFLIYSLHYPRPALLELTNLRELTIDEANADNFGKDYQLLRNMSTLKFGVDGNCATVPLTDNFFIGFPSLRTLLIYGCSPKSISPLAFKSNLELDTLNYTKITYNFEKLLDTLSGITNFSLSTLVLNDIISGNDLLTLTAAHVKNIRQLHHLKELHLEGNMISIITFDFAGYLPASLRRINLNRNDIFRVNSILKFVQASKNLASLEILNEDLEITFTSRSTDSHLGAHGPCQCDTLIPEKNSSIEHLIHLRPSLNHLKMYTAIGTSQFNSDIFAFRNLQVVNISDAFPTRWGNYKLQTSVRVVDVTNNYFEHLENSFFLPNNSLEEMHAGGNFLGIELSYDVFGRKFARLRGLRYLDLSRNQIQDLPWNVFIGLEQVQKLIFSRNKIQKLEVNVSHLIKLEYLDLSWNSISWISHATRGHLDMIALHHVVSLNLAYNPIPCTCAGIDFLKWLASTNVRIIDRDFMVCVDETSEIKPLGDIQHMTTTLQRKCGSHVNLVLASSFSCAVFIILISSVLLFKNRWRLYYIKNLVITRWYGYKAGDPQKTGNNFKFDAYLLYSKLDRHFVMRKCISELEEKRGHKLCVEDRDFLLGSFVPCNITSAIQNSHLTLAIISPDFWDSEWTEYATHMSIMESLYSKRSILHLILYKPFPIEEMPRDLVKIHKDNRFIEYPPKHSGVDAKNAFWDALSLLIGHTGNMDENPVLQI